MNVIPNLAGLGGLPGSLHVAIGVFDGIHLGHRKVIQAAIDSAERAEEGTPCVLTFDPHPVRILAPTSAPRLLTSTTHKLKLIEEMGIDHVVVQRFDREFADKSAEKFVIDLHEGAASLDRICVGAGWRFGKGGSGDLSLLEQLGQRYDFEVSGIATIEIDGSPVSSTRIREAVAGGDFCIAETLLGRPYTVLGSVIEGRKLGRQLGFPTANLTVHSEQLPPTGVYAVQVQYQGQEKAGVANLGYRPSVEGEAGKRLLEVHLLDWNGNLYGEDLEVRFVRFLRPEQRFEGLEELKEQIQRDSTQARQILAK